MAEPVQIRLTTGLIALVDAEDAPRVLAHRWHPTHPKTRPDRAYAQRTWNKNCVHHTEPLHRFILGAKAGEVVDHINGDRLDCRKANLRFVTHRDNIRNIRLSKNQRAGGYKGVRQARGKSWTATIRVGPLEASGSSRRVHLGTFKSPELAAHAYDRAALAAFGEFAATNFELVDGAYRVSAATLAAREQAAAALGLMAGGTRD